MANDSRSERERLKEEYKAHYRKMRDIKERASRPKRTQSIANALKNMDKTEMLNSFDDFLYSVKHKVASVEARLDLAMDSLSSESDDNLSEQEMDEEIRKSNAKDTLRQVKLEMGLLYNEIEEQANNIKVNKTIGRNSSPVSDGPENNPEGE
jgi:hypothetical protein